jgi:hypothetical protein
LHPVEIQRGLPPLEDPYDPAGEYSGPLRRNVRIPVQRQHAHGRIVVVHYFPLRRLARQFLQCGLQDDCGFRYDLALRRHRQRDAQTLFQALQPVPRNSAPVPQQGDHARRRLIVLLLAHAFRRRGRKHIPAQIAPQLLQLIDGRGDGRLPLIRTSTPGSRCG